MPAFKDHFSRQAAAYSRYRPAYPPELVAYVASLGDPGHPRSASSDGAVTSSMRRLSRAASCWVES